MPTAHSAQLSRIRLEYFEHGHGPHRVLLVHGFEASARIWTEVQLALPKDLYTSIAINNRGAGNSDAPPDDDAYAVAQSGPSQAVTELLAIVPEYFERRPDWWRAAIDGHGRRVGFVLPVLV